MLFIEHKYKAFSISYVFTDEIEEVQIDNTFIRKHYAMDKQQKNILSCAMIRISSDEKKSTSYEFPGNHMNLSKKRMHCCN